MKMSEEAVEEMSVLSAIYCDRGEFEVIEESAQRGIAFRICTAIETADEKTPISLIFRLSPEYPHTPPDVSVNSSELSRKQCQELSTMIVNKARTLPRAPMVHELVTWVQQNSCVVTATSPCLHSPNASYSNAEGTWTALLHLDHMRAKAKYIKVIEKWTLELGLTGRLFVGKPILILLQGTKESIKEYIHLQRTAKVDVDSSGKRCKERMMSVLCEMPLPEDFKKLSTFEIKEPLSLDDLRKEFDITGSLKLYQEFVPSLL
ncbi:RWD domain-containing protein 3 [Brachyhypopomus gauderio]|uniref:RWD domain-containing protein 3 n=1 Tax=Brachyhypopomus gauderio TaxID=698409 RepID=UPI004041E5BA